MNVTDLGCSPECPGCHKDRERQRSRLVTREDLDVLLDAASYVLDNDYEYVSQGWLDRIEAAIDRNTHTTA